MNYCYILYALFGAIHLSGAIRVTRHPQPKTVDFGDEVSLSCSGEDATINGWLLNGAEIDASRYRLETDGSLFIDSFETSYAGSYQCVLKNVDGAVVSEPAEIVYFDTNGEFEASPSDFTVYGAGGVEVTPAAFQCTFSSQEFAAIPNITWEMARANIITALTSEGAASVRPIFSYRSTSFLQLHEPLAYDGIRFRCVASSNSFPSEVVKSAWGLLTVTDDAAPSNLPPFSTTPIKYVLMNKGDSVVVGCTTTRVTDSLPLSWAFTNNSEILLKGVDFSLNPSAQLSLYGVSNLFVDSNLNDFHGKSFVCQILQNSGLGFLQRPVTFIVYDALVVDIGRTLPDSEPLDRRDILLGEGFEVPVIVDQSTPANVLWFHNGKSLKASEQGRVLIGSEGVPGFALDKPWTSNRDVSLKVADAKCSDEGFYQALISNPFGSITYTLFINVTADCIDGGEVTGPEVGGDDGGWPWWIIIVVLILLLLLLLLLLLCCCCWRRKFVVYEAEKLEERYHKEYNEFRTTSMEGSPDQGTKDNVYV